MLSFRSYFVFRSRLVCKDLKVKKAIDNLKDYAELAWASYFKFDFLKDANNIPRKIYELDSKQIHKIDKIAVEIYNNAII